MTPGRLPRAFGPPDWGLLRCSRERPGRYRHWTQEQSGSPVIADGLQLKVFIDRPKTYP